MEISSEWPAGCFRCGLVHLLLASTGMMEIGSGAGHIEDQIQVSQQKEKGSQRVRPSNERTFTRDGLHWIALDCSTANNSGRRCSRCLSARNEAERAKNTLALRCDSLSPEILGK
jgi:hypothetical protein